MNASSALISSIVLITIGGILLYLCLIHKDRRGPFLFLGFVVTLAGFFLGIAAISNYNHQLENQIRVDGPALIERLLSEEPMLLPDEKFPKAMSRMAKRLGFASETVELLAKRTNYTVVFRLDGVPTATNELPKAP